MSTITTSRKSGTKRLRLNRRTDKTSGLSKSFWNKKQPNTREKPNRQMLKDGNALSVFAKLIRAILVYWSAVTFFILSVLHPT